MENESANREVTRESDFSTSQVQTDSKVVNTAPVVISGTTPTSRGPGATGPRIKLSNRAAGAEDQNPAYTDGLRSKKNSSRRSYVFS